MIEKFEDSEILRDYREQFCRGVMKRKSILKYEAHTTISDKIEVGS